MVSLFCGNWFSPVLTGASRPCWLRYRSNLMPISIPNYNCKTDRFQFGMLIGMTSESPLISASAPSMSRRLKAE
jgi:hypothetical protein